MKNGISLLFNDLCKFNLATAMSELEVELTHNWGVEENYEDGATLAI